MTNQNRAMSERRVREIARNEMQALLRKTKALDDSAAQELSDLDDVDTAGALNADVLSFHTGLSSWIPRTLPASVEALSDLDDVDTAGATHGQFLFYNQGDDEWQPINPPPIPADLSDLNDVHDAAPDADDVLTWNEAESRWEPKVAPGASGAETLSELDDVDTTGVTDGQILVYNNAAGEWLPDDLPSAVGSLDDLTDVLLDNPGEHDVLTHDGISWVNNSRQSMVRNRAGASNQNIPGNDTLQMIQFENEVSSEGDIAYSGGTFTINKPGLYLINCFVIIRDMSGQSGGDRINLDFRVNTVQRGEFRTNIFNNQVNIHAPSFTFMWPFEADDEMVVNIQQDTGSQGFIPGNVRTNIQIFRLS